MPYIRQATESDMPQIEYICRMTAGPKAREDAETGKKIALTYSTCYARSERETCFVLDDGGKAVGYILCAPDYKRFVKDFRANEVKTLWTLDKNFAATAYILPFGYMPFYKKYPAHLHINLLDGYRGKGYGGELMKALTAKLREMNLPGVMLIVDGENTGAQRFYERAGFKKKLAAFGGVVMTKEL